MTVKQAIEDLSKLPPTALLMVASQGQGCSVPLQAFEDADAKETNPAFTHWVDVIYCEDSERKDYNLSPL